MDSLREKIAQMFIVGCRGENTGDDERLLFEEYAFGIIAVNRGKSQRSADSFGTRL